MSEQLREAIVTEAVFATMVRERLSSLTRHIASLLRQDPAEWRKPQIVKLISTCHDAETFLDDHGARNNKAFSYLAECVASIRGLGKSAAALKHLESRLDRYLIAFDGPQRAQFISETALTSRFLTASIAKLIQSILKEFDSLGIAVASATEGAGEAAVDVPKVVLPHNIDEENALDEEQQIAEVAARYLTASDRISEIAGRVQVGVDLREFVLRNLDEEVARSLESQIHSIQSKYDTFVRMTSIESRTPALARLRGHASLALHLLEIGVELVHFYVRHENDVRYEPAKDRIAQLVDKNEVLRRIVMYCLVGANQVLGLGRAFADEVLRIFVSTHELEVEVPEGLSLHARPVSLVVRIVAHYGTPVKMTVGSDTCNAGSIMETILAIGANPSARRVKFAGDARALRDVRLLFEHRLGEDGVQQLPEQLGYLWK